MEFELKSIKDKTKSFDTWKELYNWSNCKLSREEYGKFIASYIGSDSNNSILNLNGKWGTGKTQFQKRLYTEFRSQGFAVVYIDAWESDFSSDPLLAVVSELVNQLNQYNDNLATSLDNFQKSAGKLFKGVLTGAAAIASHMTVGNAAAGKALADNALKDSFDYKSAIEKLEGNFKEQQEGMYSAKADLCGLSEVLAGAGLNSKVIVLVDELDRCRPDYAIELLEIVKHFFDLPNFSFLISTDTEQLQHSINAVYGSNFNSRKYLKRFFDRQLMLPKPSILEYLTAKCFNIYEYQYPNILLAPQRSDNIDINITIASLAEMYQLSLRDVDQLITQLSASLKSVGNVSNSNVVNVINIAMLVNGLIEYNKGSEIFDKRNNEIFIPSNLNIPFVQLDEKENSNNFLTANFEFIAVTTENDNRYGHGRRTREVRLRLGVMDHYHENCASGYFRNYYWQLERVVEQINYSQATIQKHNWWTWSDYKHVIELAGHIK